MYEDKRKYYTSNYRVQEVDRHIPPCREIEKTVDTGSVFYQFLGTTYHDMEQLFKSMTQQNSTGISSLGICRRICIISPTTCATSSALKAMLCRG